MSKWPTSQQVGMATMEVWFDRLPPEKRKALSEDPQALARAAWEGALDAAKESLVAKADRAHARGDYKERDRLQSAAGALQAEQV